MANVPNKQIYVESINLTGALGARETAPSELSARHSVAASDGTLTSRGRSCSTYNIKHSIFDSKDLLVEQEMLLWPSVVLKLDD